MVISTFASVELCPDVVVPTPVVGGTAYVLRALGATCGLANTTTPGFSARQRTSHNSTDSHPGRYSV